MSHDERVEGQVAAILTRYQLVINRGSDHGVQDGMKFAVLNRNAVDITDPETGKSLGTVDVAKVQVEAIRTESNLSVCRTFRTRRVGGSLDIGAMDLFAPKRTVRESLRSSDSPAAAELDPSESVVAVGDPIVEILDDDEFSTE